MAARKECTSRQQTEYYSAHRKSIPGAFYHPKTASSQEERCNPTTNRYLRKLLNVSAEDEVEHIIDSTNGPSELIDCDKNIRGNLIIARGTWNNQVGKLCWTHAEAEKRKVYGDVIVDFAYASVNECCQSQYRTTIFQGFVGIIAIMVTIGLIFYFLKRLSPKDYQQVNVTELNEITH
ncbi:Hypothetical protein POVR1_LOCUS377 [uncultured virus]|nr:Hypothetical protein POVR1_LOCUS377 [uncultured virus]